ncbi:MAG: marine proteobacterial sortase target protein [Aestuariivirga sp.]|nr:marine proteobacterial sortase target protein [Aestuariivirga sp.]
MNTYLRARNFKARLDIIVAIFGLACILALTIFGQARAGEAKLALITPNDVKAGSLLLKSTEGGKYLEAPRLATDFNVTISGPTARTIVTQRFENPADGFVEGVYVFPLPENSAVDTLKIIAGNRVIVGEVKERQEAKVIYEEAKASGQAAALLEQERPNLFTNSVANIGPHETVIVQIEYQETVKQSSGTFSLRLPLVVAPRYMPAPIVQSVDFSSDGFGVAVNDPVPDRERISPPVLDPKKRGPVNPTTISVTLNAGFEVGEVKSLYHAIKTDLASRVISLADENVPADKDFALEWQAASTAPQAGLFTETVNGKNYLLGFVTPPVASAAEVFKPRETIFVIDNSGSMEGPSMVQAKDSLIYGLSQMKPGDRFNVIRFDDTMDQLFTDAVSADRENIDRAKAFVSRLNANGGTEMIPPMRAALQDSHASDTSHLRQVVFLTDGAIGNEQQLFATISKGLGRSRVFMVGIGSAPNSYLMTRAAELGRGTFTHIGEAAEVTARMQDLFSKIGSPVVTELKAELVGNSARITPDMLPDLYRGEPVLLMAAARDLGGSLKISGNIGAQPWEVTLPIAKAAKGDGISKLWARRRIADFEVASTLGTLTSDAANKAILAMALDHQIVSSQTSLVAVDKTPKRPAGEKLTRADIPLNLPAGWDYDWVFGDDKPAAEQRDAQLEFMQLALLQKPAAIPAQQQVMLPQTATPAEFLLLIAGFLLVLSLAFRLAIPRQSPRQM